MTLTRMYEAICKCCCNFGVSNAGIPSYIRNRTDVTRHLVVRLFALWRFPEDGILLESDHWTCVLSPFPGGYMAPKCLWNEGGFQLEPHILQVVCLYTATRSSTGDFHSKLFFIVLDCESSRSLCRFLNDKL